MTNMRNEESFSNTHLYDGWDDRGDICQEDIVVQGLMDGPLWNEKYEYGRCAGGGILNSSGFQLHTLIYDDDGE